MQVQTFTPHLGRNVFLRDHGSDSQVWADTFTGLYHLPPDTLPTPATVLDLGANIGLTAAHYAHLWPDARIVAVEMDTACCELIRVNAPTVTVREQAVSAAGGPGTYDPNVRAEAFRFSRGHGLSVDSFRLETIVMREFGRGVDFVKMDVEGEEWNLFKSGPWWTSLVRALLVELHGDGGSAALVARAVDELTRLGYRAGHHPPHPQAVFAHAGGTGY